MSGAGGFLATSSHSALRKRSVAVPLVMTTCHGWALHQDGVRCEMLRMRTIRSSATGSRRNPRQLWRVDRRRSNVWVSSDAVARILKSLAMQLPAAHGETLIWVLPAGRAASRTFKYWPGRECRHGPAPGLVIGATSAADRSGVSSFQRTDPMGRSSMRRIRIGSGPI